MASRARLVSGGSVLLSPRLLWGSWPVHAVAALGVIWGSWSRGGGRGGGRVGVLALGGGSRPGQLRAQCWLSPRFPLPSAGSHPLLQEGVWGSPWKSCAAHPRPAFPPPTAGQSHKSGCCPQQPGVRRGRPGKVRAPRESLPWWWKPPAGRSPLPPAWGRRRGVPTPCPALHTRV